MKESKVRQPIISVVMSVFNAEQYLEEAIESVLFQTFTDFEFIIIDDGSSDQSLKIIEKFSSKDDRIVYISRANRGIIHSLNEGLGASRGTYVARMDADDVCYPERLEKQYEFMITNGLDICGGDYISIGQDGSFKSAHVVPKDDFEILLTMVSNVPFAHPSVMIKKQFLTKHNLMYGANGHKSADDLDLWINMYDAGAKFGNLDTFILKYRLLSSSFSVINHRKMKIEVDKQFELFVKENHKNIKVALKLFCLKKSSSDNLQRVATKAFLRYMSFDFSYKLCYQIWLKVSIYNFIFALLSYVNSRLIFKWAKSEIANLEK